MMTVAIAWKQLPSFPGPGSVNSKQGYAIHPLQHSSSRHYHFDKHPDLEAELTDNCIRLSNMLL